MSTAPPVSIIRGAARAHPDRPAITAGSRTVTYGELAERSFRVGQGLVAAGVAPGDRVALIDMNGPEYFEIFFGAGTVKAVTVAVNWRLTPDEMAWIINDAGAMVVFVDPEVVGDLAALESRLSSPRRIVVLGSHPHTSHESYETWLLRQPAIDPGGEGEPHGVCLQLYTSGTTGRPKGAMLTNANIGAVFENISRRWSLTDQDVHLVAMPLFHIGGSGAALLALFNGCRMVMMRDADPSGLLKAIEREGVTHTFLVPAVLQFMLQVPGVEQIDCRHLRMIAYGAAPISDSVLTQCMAVFACNLVQVYGLTETTGGITELAAGDHDPSRRPELLRSCGQPYPWVELRIVDPDRGADVPDGEIGEVWVRSPQNMLGYWNAPEETARTVVNGWLRTGDAAFRRDGFLFLHDRIKDMIVTGGENVYPAEVENVLMDHEAVADVAVVGVPDERWGEAVKAVIVPASGVDVDAATLIDYCRSRLAHYKCPTSIDWAEALPRNASGKLLKRQIRAPYWIGRHRLVN